ncbi:hypothetical protein BVG79_00161 [Ketogulonicigenium robustum]|uniref:Uncharacterized protein n=1 Tax=Ketogulonicigenium robustum TaxID=92947 RepID=A0A1W6NWD9_9RHOB|nr:hypothetical protein [Ketogulonicigenium robustum]ARO13521.1 hypothetical protein BVG79_00161 [Ketogulonicigenium robustum]
MAKDECENNEGIGGVMERARLRWNKNEGVAGVFQRMQLARSPFDLNPEIFAGFRKIMADALEAVRAMMQRLTQQLKGCVPNWLQKAKPRRGRPVGTSYDDARAPFLAEAIALIKNKVAKGAYAAARMIVEAVGWALTLTDAIALGKVPGASCKAAEDALARYIVAHIKKINADQERANAQRVRCSAAKALIAT